MIGSVSSGFRRRRRRHASRTAVAATVRTTGSRHLPPADSGDASGIPAGCESIALRSDRCAWSGRPPDFARLRAWTRCDFSFASGVAASMRALRERARKSAAAARVPDSRAVRWEAAGELSGRIVEAWPVATAGLIAGAAPSVVSEAAARVSTEGLAPTPAATAGAPSETGAVAAGSTEPALPAIPAGVASTLGGVVDAERVGSRVSGST
jgi:hypothetical protein